MLCLQGLGGTEMKMLHVYCGLLLPPIFGACLLIGAVIYFWPVQSAFGWMCVVAYALVTALLAWRNFYACYFLWREQK